MIIRRYVKTLTSLAHIIDSSDVCRRRHCYKVEKYSLMICRKMKLPPREIRAIKIASILHDIGKIGIDLDIIKKPAKLNPEEWAKIRLHPEIGTNIVKQTGFLDEMAPIIKYHHARYNGGGYPDPDIKGEAIPVGSRIICVTDAFDAMTSERPYRAALSTEAALAELKRCSGSQFDPRIVDIFLNSYPSYSHRENK